MLDELSRILGVRVFDINNLDAVVRNFDKSGKFNQRVILEMLIMVIKKINELDNKPSLNVEVNSPK